MMQKHVGRALIAIIAFTCVALTTSSKADTPVRGFGETASAAVQCQTIPAGPPVGDQPRIAAQSLAWIGCLDNGFGAPCMEACVATVNHLVFKAIAQYLGNDPSVNNTDNLRANGDVSKIHQRDAVPGDFMIVDSADLKNAHIGVCLDVGCTDVISNSSSTCRFVFRSSHDAKFTYPGSPYIGGFARYYRAVKRSGPPPRPQAATHNAFGDLSPLPVYATPSAKTVEATCLTKGSDMALKRWAYAQGHLLCVTADEHTGGQQFYTEVTPGKFVLTLAGGGTFRVGDLVSQPSSVNHNALQTRPMDPDTAATLINAVTTP